jgi:MATE family, multidrug efflux pump
MVNSTFRSRFMKYWSLFKSAIRGDDYDYTKIDLRKAVVLLAIPMMLELSMESVFAVTDIFFVNKLGIHAVSVVGLTESVITIVYSVGIGLSAAATAIVARRVGEKKNKDASLAGAQAILIAIICSIALAIPGFLFAEEILQMMGAEPNAIKEGLIYTQIMFGGNAAIVIIFLMNGVFRGAGNAAIAMKSLWIGNIFNIVLDPLLIFGIGFFPEMGIKGAALATVLGRTVGIMYQLYHLKYSSNILTIRWVDLKPKWLVIRNLISIASPATFQFIIGSASWIFLAALVAQYGSAASAGYQTAVRLIMFFILPAWGMSNAVATLVGQNLGAHQPDRAERSVYLTSKYNAVFMAFVTAIFLFYARPLVGIFIPIAEIAQIDFAVLSLQLISLGYIFYGVGMVVTQAFNGSGDTKTPTYVHLLGFWVFQIPLAYGLHHFTSFGITGVIAVIPIAETFMAIVMFLLFRQGKWKNTKI